MSDANKTILIVDDDAELLTVLASRCKQSGFNVATASCATTALTLALELQPDVVCLDVDLPGGNGLAAAEMLQSNAEIAKTPVVIITGRTDHEIERRCHQLSAFYIPKVDTWKRLQSLLNELFDLPTTIDGEIAI